ncbi:MAG: nitrogenase component 1 [Lachnospiraceae bacterium]|nr:nitrogenase component 1 [Lachnospiraceae bacterium]
MGDKTNIARPRNGCALHGALWTVEEIRGAVPIVHANAGCSFQSSLSLWAGGGGSPKFSGSAVPSTNSQERHIIFGGASRLREQIKNTVKVVDGDLYVVLTGCEAAMVGDDVDAMTKEASDQGLQVIDSQTPGIRGDVHQGYEQVMSDLVEKIPGLKGYPAPEKDEKLINVFGILPHQNFTFRGDLAEIRRILEGAGYHVHTFFGPVDGVEELKRAPGAALSISFSRWGDKAAESLQRQYGIPVLKREAPPTGYAAARDLLETVAELVPADKERLQSFLAAEKETFSYYLGTLRDIFYEKNISRRIAVVGDEAEVTALSHFLTDYLGACVENAIVTDFLPADGQSEDERREKLSSLAENVSFTQDSHEIARIVRHSGAGILVASSLERAVARAAGIELLETTFPVFDSVALGASHTGIHGALELSREYISAVLRADAGRKERVVEEIVVGG